MLGSWDDAICNKLSATLESSNPDLILVLLRLTLHEKRFGDVARIDHDLL